MTHFKRARFQIPMASTKTIVSLIENDSNIPLFGLFLGNEEGFCLYSILTLSCRKQ